LSETNSSQLKDLGKTSHEKLCSRIDFGTLVNPAERTSRGSSHDGSGRGDRGVAIDGDYSR
jgi:hypothetical protein